MPNRPVPCSKIFVLRSLSPYHCMQLKVKFIHFSQFCGERDSSTRVFTHTYWKFLKNFNIIKQPVWLILRAETGKDSDNYKYLQVPVLPQYPQVFLQRSFITFKYAELEQSAALFPQFIALSLQSVQKNKTVRVRKIAKKNWFFLFFSST